MLTSIGLPTIGHETEFQKLRCAESLLSLRTVPYTNIQWFGLLRIDFSSTVVNVLTVRFGFRGRVVIMMAEFAVPRPVSLPVRDFHTTFPTGVC